MPSNSAVFFNYFVHSQLHLFNFRYDVYKIWIFRHFQEPLIFFQILMWTSRNFLDDAFYLTFFTIFFGAAGGVGLLAVHRPSYCT